MKAWEYVNENRLKNASAFINTFQHIYNNQIPPFELRSINPEEIDKSILFQTFERLEARKSK